MPTDCVKQDGNSPLHCASLRGHADVAELLLDQGANTATVDDVSGNNGIHTAYSVVFSFDCVHYHEFLICVFQNGWSPLHKAAHGGRVETALLLLNRGANMEAMDKVSQFVSMFSFSDVTIDRTRPFRTATRLSITRLCLSGWILFGFCLIKAPTKRPPDE